ncbi:MAG: hypothetical protein GY884_31850, partial [Proteobacteria bacterium]|nr:hypothetical protein [Pseudomonadota bacterium]
MSALLWLALSCNGDDGPHDVADSSVDSPVDSPVDSSADPGQDSVPVEWVELTGDCVEPDGLGEDPLQPTGSIRLTQETPGQSWFVELIDLEVDGDRIYGAGQGGVTAYDISDPANPTNPGHYPPDNSNQGRFHRVEVVGEDLVAATHREAFLEVLDFSDPSVPTSVFQHEGYGLEGMAHLDERLYVSQRGGSLLVFSTDDWSHVEHTGFGENTWELASDGSSWLYAADNAGLIPISLADPDAPAVQATVDMGGVLHAVVDGDWMYAAQASRGVAVLERSDPAAPELVTMIPVSGSAVQISVGDSVLWIADHEGLATWDVSDPTSPSPTGHQVSEQFALSVAHVGDVGWLGDWNILSSWTLEPGSPELDIGRSELDLSSGQTTAAFRNWGASTLTLAGVDQV